MRVLASYNARRTTEGIASAHTYEQPHFTYVKCNVCFQKGVPQKFTWGTQSPWDDVEEETH